MACPFGSGYAWVRFAPSRVRDQATPIPHAIVRKLSLKSQRYSGMNNRFNSLYLYEIKSSLKFAI